MIKPGETAQSQASWAACFDNSAPKTVSEAGGTTYSSWNLSAGRNERIATMADFGTLTTTSATALDFEVQKAYGVLYGDGATETAVTIADAYGYDSQTGADSPKGMRGVILYNLHNYRQVFLLMGFSGFGRRMVNRGGWHPDLYGNGTLHYASRMNPSSAVAVNQPLFYDLCNAPGAIYWCRDLEFSIRRVYIPVANKSVEDINYSSAFDINFNTLGFEAFLNCAIGSDSVQKDGSASGACFIRTVFY